MGYEGNDIIEVKENGTVEVNGEFTLQLTREYDFEGEKISVIDFSGLNDLTAADMIKANKVMVADKDVTVLPEMSLHYALITAASCTKHPIEFYITLKPRDAMRVKNMVTNFFFGEE